MPVGYSDPNADFSIEWSRSTGSNSYSILAQGVQQPATPSTTNYIQTCGGYDPQTDIYDMGFVTGVYGAYTVSQVKIWIYGTGPEYSSIFANVYMGGAWQTAQDFIATTTAGWYSATFNGSWTATDAANMQVQLEVNGYGGCATVYAMYAEVTYSGGTSSSSSSSSSLWSSSSGGPTCAMSTGVTARHYNIGTALSNYPLWELYTPATVTSHSQINFPSEPFWSGGPNDYFASRIVGYIKFPTSGTYSFRTYSDDGSRFMLGGSWICTNDGVHGGTFSNSGNFTPPGDGYYPFEFWYFENNGGANAYLYWTPPGGTEVLVPASAFYRCTDNSFPFSSSSSSSSSHTPPLGHVGYLDPDGCPAYNWWTPTNAVDHVDALNDARRDWQGPPFFPGQSSPSDAGYIYTSTDLDEVIFTMSDWAYTGTVTSVRVWVYGYTYYIYGDNLGAAISTDGGSTYATEATIMASTTEGWFYVDFPVNLNQSQVNSLRVKLINHQSYYGGSTVFAMYAELFGSYGAFSSSSSSSSSATGVPTTVPNLIQWFDASQITGLSNNDPVSFWQDIAGNNPATQSNSSYRPLYITNAVNGRPVVRFDASDDRMATTLSVTGAFTMFVVYVERTATSRYARAVNGGGTNWLVGPYSGFASYYANGWGGNSIEALVANRTYVNTVINDLTTAKFYVNGADRTQANYLDRPGLIGLGAQGQYADPLGADLCEVIIYSGAISDSNRRSIESYLATKWAATFSSVFFIKQ